ncbi:hypothetical protein B4135_3122 [Caldibacillus debilis]|jgi:hypothetical protein|uniref:Uncharacterized protein n=1 Tax=Caldibacillus debilis TaxID=301148 RepID=A0A150LIQ8_9BACI|nr:hypothetical protein B4135_3122 [Caldibacillus debilis]
MIKKFPHVDIPLKQSYPQYYTRKQKNCIEKTVFNGNPLCHENSLKKILSFSG